MVKNFKISGLAATLYLPSETPKEMVIGIHGFAGDKESSVLIALAKELAEDNITMLTYDLPCHSENISDKPLNLKECIDSVNEAYKYVKSNYGDLDISFFATSFGAYILLNFLSDNDVECKNIILRAPAIFMHKTLTDNIMPEFKYTLSDLETPKEFGYNYPVYVDKTFYNDLVNQKLDERYISKHFLNVIQGKKDNVVSPKDNAEFFENKCSGNYNIYYFENADHRFKNPGELDEIIKISKDILTNKNQ